MREVRDKMHRGYRERLKESFDIDSLVNFDSRLVGVRVSEMPQWLFAAELLEKIEITEEMNQIMESMSAEYQRKMLKDAGEGAGAISAVGV